MLTTIGYERRERDELVDLLVDAGVEVLVDVRATPRSRKPGLSKRRLAQALEQAGIDYVHEPWLGVPREHREAFRAGDPETVAAYRRRLTSDGSEAVARVAGLAAERDVALLCYERDEERCHRRLVAEAVVSLAPDVDRTAI